MFICLPYMFIYLSFFLSSAPLFVASVCPLHLSIHLSSVCLSVFSSYPFVDCTYLSAVIICLMYALNDILIIDKAQIQWQQTLNSVCYWFCMKVKFLYNNNWVSSRIYHFTNTIHDMYDTKNLVVECDFRLQLHCMFSVFSSRKVLN